MKDQSKIQRKYSINDNFFDEIDSEVKAYFLGLLFSDGCNDTSRNTITLGLQAQDAGVLNLLNSAIGSTRPLGFFNVKKYNPNWQNQYRLYITNKRISQKLSDYGCVRNKSLILQFPSVMLNSPFLRDFVRGYFDGDGSISIYHDKNNNCTAASCMIISTKNFCDVIKTTLCSLGINSFFEKPRKNHSKNTRILRISGTQQIFRFLKWMYEDSSIHLIRKFEKFEELRRKLNEKGLLNEA